MRHLITGGSGFIGTALARHLLDAGHHVTTLDRATPLPHPHRHEYHHERLADVLGDVRDAALVSMLVQRVDRVWHLASRVGVRHYIESAHDTVSTTLDGAAAVIDACAKHGRPLMLASTSEAYGKPVKLPMHELDDIRFGDTGTTRWVYGMAKALSEQLALAAHRHHGLDVRIFRPFNIVGPGQNPDSGLIFPSYAQAIIDGTAIKVHGDGQQTRTFCGVSDLVSGIVRLSEAPHAAGVVVNLGSPVEVPVIEVADAFAYEASRQGRPTPTRMVPYEHDYPEGFEDTRRRVPDLSRARELIGWHPELLTPLHALVRWTVSHAIETAEQSTGIAAD